MLTLTLTQTPRAHYAGLCVGFGLEREKPREGDLKQIYGILYLDFLYSSEWKLGGCQCVLSHSRFSKASWSPSAPLIPSTTYPGAQSLAMATPNIRTGPLLLVLNPFCPIPPEVVFPHHFFLSEVCSEACSRHTGCHCPFPSGCAWLEPGHSHRCPFVLPMAWGPPLAALAPRLQCQTLLLNAQHDNWGFYISLTFHPACNKLEWYCLRLPLCFSWSF